MQPKFRPSLGFLFTLLAIFSLPSHSFKQSDYQILDLYSTTDSAFSTESSSWFSTTGYTGSLTTNCGGTPLYSGDGIPTGAGPFQRKYENLPTHASVVLSFEVWLIDLPGTTVDGNFAFGTASDPVVQTKATYSSVATDQTFATTSTCGTSENDLTGVTIIRTFAHTDPTLYISLASTAGYAGYRNLKIIIPTGDLSAFGNCAISSPMMAISATNRCKCEVGKYWSTSSSICASCDSACLNCYDAGSSACFSCADGYYYDGAKCTACDSTCSTCFGSGTTSCLTCPSGDAPDSNSQCSAVSTAVQNMINVKSSTQKIVGVGLILSSVANAGGSSAVRVSVIGKMIQYIKYLELNYPSNIEASLTAADSDFLTFGGGDEVDKTPSGLIDNESEYHELPSAFTNYDQVDPSFMINFWNQLKILLIISGILIFAIAIEFIAHKNESKFLPMKHIHKLRITVMGLLLNYVYNDAADVFFFALITYRATDNKTSLANLNIAMSGILIIGTVSLLTAHFCLIKKYQKIKKDNKDSEEPLEKFKNKYEGMSALWQDFKDTSLFSMGYLWLAITRDIIFCLILTLLFEHPLAQTVLIFLMSIGMMVYLCKLRPIEEAPDMVQTILCEGVLLIINFCLLILAGMDKDRTGSTTTRENLGMAILVLTMIFNFIPMAFLLVTLYGAIKAAYEFYQAYKLKRAQAKQNKLDMHVKKNQIAPLELMKEESSVISPNSTQGILSPMNIPRSPLRGPFKSHFAQMADENMSGLFAREDALFNVPMSPSNQPLRLNDSIYRNKEADPEVSLIELDKEKLPEMDKPEIRP